MFYFDIGNYTYCVIPDGNGQGDRYCLGLGERSINIDHEINSYDQVLHQSLDKIFRKRCSSSSSSSQSKKFRLDPQDDTDWKSIIKPILEQESVLSKYFSKEELGNLSLLWIAVLAGYKKSVELLVRSGFDVNELFGRHVPQVIDEKWTVLYVLLQMDRSPEDERLIRLVTDHSADLQARDSKAQTVLHIAVIKGWSVQMAEILLEKGADLQARDSEGRTALYFAVKYDRSQMFSLFLEKGADLQARDSEGRTALHIALKQGQVQMSEMLLGKGADVNVADDKGMTPLLEAANSRKANELLPLLIKRGVDVSARDKFGQNVLHYLIRMPNVKHAIQLTKDFLEMGALLDDKTDSCKYQPIHIAAGMGNVELVNLYLDHGANVNAQAHKGSSPLHYATSKNNTAMLRTLLKRGADVNRKITSSLTRSSTALHHVCEQLGDDERVSLLLSAGADVLIEDSDGNTPFALINADNMTKPGTYLMVKKLALIKVSQPGIELKDEKIIEQYPDLQKYYRNCIEQFERMKSTRFIETCTFLDLLSKCHCQIAPLMRNPEFKSKFKLFDLNTSEFAAYAEDIIRAFERTEKHHQSVLEQENVLFEALQDLLPYVIVRRVSHYMCDCCEDVK